MIEPIARVGLESEISAIFNHDHSCAVLLDQKNGRYWRISGKLLQILLILSESTDGFSIEELRDRLNVRTREQETQLNAAITSLKAGILIREVKQVDDLKSMSRVEISSTASQKRSTEHWMVNCFPPITHNETSTQPPAWLVIGYAFLNLYYRIALYFRGWAVIRAVMSKMVIDAREQSQITFAEKEQRNVEELFAAGRLACVFPFVRALCTCRALTVHTLLRGMGYSPILRIGGKVEPFEPHMWVELNGIRIDSGIVDHSLDRFELLRNRTEG